MKHGLHMTETNESPTTIDFDIAFITIDFDIVFITIDFDIAFITRMSHSFYSATLKANQITCIRYCIIVRILTFNDFAEYKCVRLEINNNDVNICFKGRQSPKCALFFNLRNRISFNNLNEQKSA